MKMLTNCPNCGAPLTSDGYCEYCKTKIRYANHMEVIEEFGNCHRDVEILLKLKRGDTTRLVPFIGKLETFTMDHYTTNLYCDNTVCASMSSPIITLTFEGILGEIPKGDLNE